MLPRATKLFSVCVILLHALHPFSSRAAGATHSSTGSYGGIPAPQLQQRRARALLAEKLAVVTKKITVEGDKPQKLGSDHKKHRKRDSAFAVSLRHRLVGGAHELGSDWWDHGVEICLGADCRTSQSLASNRPWSFRPPHREDLWSGLSELLHLVTADPEGILASWRHDTHPCFSFERVRCDRRGFVVELDLRSADSWAFQGDRSAGAGSLGGDGMGGQGTAQLGLTLRGLPSRANFMAHIGRSLQSLRLDNTRVLNGSIPAEWARMGRLRRLSASSCGLSGTLPGAWGWLQSLRYLGLSDNPLIAGTLPHEWAALRRLHTLDLSLTRDHGEPPRLRGQLPASWAALSRLQVLDLWRTLISGTLPSEWHRLPDLQVLYLGNTSVSGSLPSAWSGMRNLTALHLAGTAVQGSLPASWSLMPKLQYIELQGTRVAGALPFAWQRFCWRKDVLVLLPWRNLHGEPLRINSTDAQLLGSLALPHRKHRANLCNSPSAYPFGIMILATAVGGASSFGRLRQSFVLPLPSATERFAERGCMPDLKTCSQQHGGTIKWSQYLTGACYEGGSGAEPGRDGRIDVTGGSSAMVRETRV